MTADVNIGINDGREVNEPLDLAALFPTAAVSVAHINRVGHLAVVGLAVRLPEADKQERGSLGIAVFNAELAAKQLRDVNAVRAVVTGFVISLEDAQDLPLLRKRLEQFRAHPQFVHWGQLRPVGITHAGRYRAIHQITIQHTETVVVRHDVVEVSANLVVVALRV